MMLPDATATTTRVLDALRALSPVIGVPILTDDADRAAIARVRRLAAEVALSARGYVTS